MKLRVRLILAFLLFSVVPLGAVTVYSYVGNYKALQAAATREADQLTSQLSERMQLVTAQLSDRVSHLMDVPGTTEAAAPEIQASATRETRDTKKSAEPAAPTGDVAALMIRGQAADTLGEAAMLLNTVELRGLRAGGGRRGPGGPPRPDQPPQPGQPGSQQGQPGDGGRGGGFRGRRGDAAFPAPTQPLAPPSAPTAPTAPASPSTPMTPPALMAQPPSADDPGARGRGARPDRVRAYKPPPPDWSRGNVPPSEGPPPPEFVGPVPTVSDDADRVQINVGPIAQEIFRQFVPEGTNPGSLTAEQRARVAAEINQRMMGISEGLKFAAAELQRKADAARKKAEADAKAQAKADQVKAATLKRRTALTGNRLDVTLEQNGKVVRSANAEINLPNVLMTVFSSMSRAQGEVPFALAKDGRVYTPTSANRAVIEQLAPARLQDGSSMVGEWIVVMTPDPTGSGLRLGIARPVGDSLSELRRTAGRNAGLGLACIGLSIALIIPLSGRLTRNLSRLTGAVTRIAHGEYSTRVDVKSKDEIGELGAAFNQMAADVEAHQRAIVGQERIKRELELGRQIQHDMQPQQPLRLGLTEIQGVSVPAREVGGDFFNYFALPDGQVALLVGDVSGKGVGAALLMANIQASLRTRFALGQDLSAIVDAIDRDIEVNSPGQMYATLFVGILDPATRILRWVNAGHHPQYVLRASGGLERMKSTGLPAGLLAGRGYAEHVLQLERGDSIFFYTDGCPETENAQDEMFGTERLEALLVESGAAGPDTVLQRVESALKAFRGSQEPYDDATMMAVRVG